MIDWKLVKNFGSHEFSEDPSRYADPTLIYQLDQFREWLDRPVYPSPAEGALARFDDSDSESRHYAVGRRSDACDVFPDAHPQAAFLLAITAAMFGGVGIYWDTYYEGEHQVMLHLDLRPHGEGHSRDTPLIWMRDETGYNYPQYQPESRTRLFRYLADWPNLRSTGS